MSKIGSKALTAEQTARLNTRCLCKLATTHFLAIVELGLQHLNHTALTGYLEALRRDIGDFADLTRYVGKAPEEGLAGVEDLQLFAAERGPGTRSRVASSNQVVDMIDRLGPVDLSFGGAAPAFVTRLRVILYRLFVFTGQY